ncbi:MAG: (2Fe-2S)-binding protein [Vicinamibacterales bacterium]
MDEMTTEANRSPIVEIYAALRARNASWAVDVGKPSGPGWIAGSDLRMASAGPFNELLLRIGEQARTTDRRTIAASYALRHGWASAMAIAPFLEHGCVPDISLENISLKFRASTFFERTAIHDPRGIMMEGDPLAGHQGITTVTRPYELLRSLRTALAAQAVPVVEALHEWSGFARRGTWGMLTSSWAEQFTSLQDVGRDQRIMLPMLKKFFEGDDIVAIMQPRMHPITCGDVTHLYQRRASCCRWYLLPGGELCATCPLVSDEERAARNLAWMRQQLGFRNDRRGHS